MQAAFGPGLYDLTGRTAIITGAGEGIGFATARLLGRFGARLVLNDVRPAVLDGAMTTLAAEGIDVRGWPGDVARRQDVEDLVARAFEGGRVDILVNNAGVGSHMLPEDVTDEEWHRVIAVNLTGSFMMARAVGRRWLADRKGGAIVNLSSIGGSSALGRGTVSFGAAKGGVNQMTRDLAVEWAGSGIRVNAIQPCQVRTPLFDAFVASQGELLERMLRGIPMRRLAVPEDVAAAVHFLVSDAAAMITGVSLPVDGGNLALNAGGTAR